MILLNFDQKDSFSKLNENYMKKLSINIYTRYIINSYII